MNPFTLLVAFASTVLFTACKGADLIPGLVIRQTNTSATGGFATRATSCSATQVDCGGGITQEICCPSGTFCFHSDDGVCCPTDTDCNEQFFAAPQCADSSWFLCTDYQPNIPSYVPNDPGYWCCPTGTQCLVSPEAGYVCSAVNNGDTPGSTVLSGQAPTQASTATTAPTLASSVTPATASSSTTKASNPIASSVKSSAFKISSFLSIPTCLGIFVAQALIALTHSVLL